MSESHALTLDELGGVLDEKRDLPSPFLSFRLSWVAFLGDFAHFVVRFIVCMVGASFLSLALDHIWPVHTINWLPIGGACVAGAWTSYSVMLTRSVQLFTNDAGVWVQSGVFPWDTRISGVQWRDLGQAGFSQGFLSWLLRSYNVRISHRFTMGTEIYLTNVRYGNLAVAHVNRVMNALQGRVVPR